MNPRQATRPHMVASVGDLVAPRDGLVSRPCYEVLETRWCHEDWWVRGPGPVQRVRLRFLGPRAFWDEGAWVQLDWGAEDPGWAIVKRAEERVAEALLGEGRP